MKTRRRICRIKRIQVQKVKWPDVELNECRIKRERTVATIDFQPSQRPFLIGFPSVTVHTVLSRLIRGSFNSTFGHFTFCIRIRLIRHIRRRVFIYYALNTRLKEGVTILRIVDQPRFRVERFRLSP